MKEERRKKKERKEKEEEEDLGKRGEEMTWPIGTKVPLVLIERLLLLFFFG